MTCKVTVQKNTLYHYRLNGDFIECWNGHGGWTKIASVIEVRPVMHLMRRCQLAEDIEELMDSFLADTSGIAPARLKKG